MSDNTDLTDAANIVMTAELTALNAIHDALATFDAALTASVANLDYPTNFPSNAERIVAALKSSLSWQSNDLSGQIAALSGTQPAAPTLPGM